MKEGEQNEEKN